MSFDTKPELFKNAVLSGVIRKQNHLNTCRLSRNSEGRGIQKQSHSISVSKRAREIEQRYEKGQIWSGNTHVIVRTRTEWTWVMCSRKNEKKREGTETHKNGVMENGPNGNELRVRYKARLRSSRRVRRRARADCFTVPNLIQTVMDFSV